MPFVRKNIRLPQNDYAGQRIFFLTICCHGRRPLLHDPALVLRQIGLLREVAAQAEFAVHAYCFMPDHIHLVVEGSDPQSQLLVFVSRYKQRTGFEYRRRHGGYLWQPRFYDHVLRRADSMESVAWYIWLNPVRKGLVKQPREYPFSGSFTTAWVATSPAKPWIPPWKDAGPMPG